MAALHQFPLFPDLEVKPAASRALAKAALRIAFFRRTPEGELAASWTQVAVLILATLLPPLLFSLGTNGVDGRIAWTDLPGVFFHVPVMLVAAIVIARAVHDRSHVVTILVATLLAWTVIDSVSLALWLAAMQTKMIVPRIVNMAFFYVPLAWLALAVARFAASLAPLSWPRKGFVLVACAAFLAAPLGGVYRERSLWIADYSKNADSAASRADRMAAASEESFYRQPELLKRALADVKPGRKGVVDVYFVGMAGYGHQDVFMREVDSVAALFRDRFRADGHIVKLVNNPKTVLSQPVASATSLKATLKRMSEVMDRDEDVLVLFLTSHGSQDHHFSLELWPLDLKQLTPEMLRAALDESGIKNRVVIVSACYAGGFIRSLADDNTLVIAAAAPDRNSFGCSNENEWTYFGRAYFDEALRKTFSFTQAFDFAKPVIEERERRENFDPSRPMMSVGSAIKDKLALLEQQLAAPVPAPAEDVALASADKAEQYVALLFQPEMARMFLEGCRRDMDMNSPEKVLERAPQSLGGLNHSNPAWPRLVAAWDHYVEGACAKAMDPQLFRAAYLAEVRSSMTDRDLDIAIRMMSSGEGREWYEKEKQVSLGVGDRIAKAQRAATEPLYAAYVRERDALYAEVATQRAASNAAGK